MRKLLFTFSLIVLFLSLSAQTLPTKTDVLDKMKLANSYFVAKWPDPSANIVTNKSRPSNLWTRGTYYEGLMQLYNLTQDASLYNYAVNWGASHLWQPTYTGTVATRIADNQCCGQAYLELYQLDPTKPERIATMQTSIDAMVNSTKSNDWWWVDALQMAMPVFAKFGVIKNDTKYYDKMYDLYSYTKNLAKGVGLYNPADSLWYRDSTFLPPAKSSNGLPIYWSRGNGWVFTALARSLDVIPGSTSHRDEYVAVFKQMAARLIRLQRPDGFWNCNLGDPNDYGGMESSGTVFFTYGLAWGINHGILDSLTYAPCVAKAWNGLVLNALHPDGSIGYMQSSGSKPADGQPLSYTKMPDFEDFGLGGFLLAGSEVYRLTKVSGGTTGIGKQVSNEQKLHAYPNPFSGSIQIQCSYSSLNPSLTILNESGQRVYRFETTGKLADNLVWNGKSTGGASLSNGLYFISLQDGVEKSQMKIMLMR